MGPAEYWRLAFGCLIPILLLAAVLYLVTRWLAEHSIPMHEANDTYMEYNHPVYGFKAARFHQVGRFGGSLLEASI